jgi:putative FmdB family regulatory protein
MPLFEYVCHTCSHQFEALVRGSGTPECPACHGADLERRLSVFAAHTNGAGARESVMAAGPCGACGDPRGPGACSIN